MTGSNSVVASDEVKEGWIIKENKDAFRGVISMYSIYLTVIVMFGFIGICIDQNSLNCIF